LLVGSEGCATLCDEEALTALAKEAGGTLLQLDFLMHKEMRSGTAEGDELAEMIRMGKIIPAAKTVVLMRNEMRKRPPPHIIVGFPKSIENLRILEEQVAPCACAIHLELSEDEHKSSLVQMGYDETRMSMKFTQFRVQTLPMISMLETKGVLHRAKPEDRTAILALLKSATSCSGAEAVGVGPVAGLPMSAPVGVTPIGPVVLMLGYSDAMKVNLCEQMATKYKGSFLSVNELLKAEVRGQSALGIEIADMIKQGKIIPAQVILKVLALNISRTDVSGPFLIDGFPRSADNLAAFEEQIGKVRFAIHLHMDEATLMERIGAADGGSNQDIEAAQRKVRTHTSQTLPTVSCLQERGLLRRIDAAASEDAILAALSVEFDTL